MVKWLNMETAPKYEKPFLCRNKTAPDAVFEAFIFIDGHTRHFTNDSIDITYDSLYDVTNETVLGDNFTNYQWSEK